MSKLMSASSHLFRMSRKIYFSTEKCTRKPNEMEKLFFFSSLLPIWDWNSHVGGKERYGWVMRWNFSDLSTILFFYVISEKSFTLHTKLCKSSSSLMHILKGYFITYVRVISISISDGIHTEGASHWKQSLILWWTLLEWSSFATIEFSDSNLHEQLYYLK